METFNKLTTGQILKTRRLEKGLTIEEVSQETKITQRFIKALENDDYEAFDSFIFASGFIKIYGKFLGLQTDKLIALYRRELKPSKNGTNLESKHLNKRKFSIKEHLTPENLVKVLLGIFVLAIFSYIYMDFYKYQESPKINLIYPTENFTTHDSTVSIKGVTNINSDIYINDNQIPVNPDFTFEYTLTLTPGTNEILIKAVNQINKNKSTEKKLVVTYETPKETPQKGESNSTKSQYNTLKLVTTNANVWVQLVVDNKQEIATVLTKPYSKEFKVKKSFQIITGRPKSTKIYFNNKQIDLKIDTETGTVNMVCQIENNNLECN